MITAGAATAAPFETLLYPGSMATVASDIDGGIIVGSWDDTAGNRSGFIYDRGTASWQNLSHPNGPAYTSLTGLDGTRMIGQYRNPGEYHGFVYEAGNWTTIDFPGSNYTLPWKIEGDIVVGFYEGAGGFGSEHAFTHNLVTGEWKSFDVPGASRTWGGGMDGGILGGHFSGSEHSGFQYDIAQNKWTVLEVPGSTLTYVLGMDEGKILGSYQKPGQPDPGFVFDGADWRSIEYPGSPETVVMGTEGDWIVGYAKLGPYRERGFIANYTLFPVLTDSNPIAVPDTTATGVLCLIAVAGVFGAKRLILPTVSDPEMSTEVTIPKR